MNTDLPVTSPAVALAKDGPEEADVCQQIDWNYHATNTGSGIARNVSLRDTLPAGLTTIDGQSTVVVDLGDIPAGQTRNATAHLKAAHRGRFSSAATVKSDAGDAASPSITTVARQPKLEISIKAPEKEYLGKRIAYQVTVTNSGDIAAQRATLRFSPSDGSKPTSVTDATGAQIAPADDGNADGASGLGTIDAGTSKVVHATFDPIAGGAFKVDLLASAKCAHRRHPVGVYRCHRRRGAVARSR